MDKQPTNQQILDLVQKSSVENKQSFDLIRQTLVENKKFFDSIRHTLTEHDDFFVAIQKSFGEIRQEMATKDDLKALETKIDKRFDKVDEKIAETRGDLVSMLRKGNIKLGTLVTKLGMRKVLPLADVQDVLAMEPFPSSR